LNKIYKLGILGIVLLGLLLIPVIFQASFEYAELTEPVNTTSRISLGSNYNAFPKVIRVVGNSSLNTNSTNSTGSTSSSNITYTNDKILTVWYSGNAHVDTNGQGKIMGAYSLDEGKSWQTPFEIYKDPRYDCRNIGITQAPNGTVSLFFAKVAVAAAKSYTWMDFGYINSIDQGKTWSDYISIQNVSSFAYLGLKSGNGYGDSIQLNSSQFILCYGSTYANVSENNVVFILRSDTNGTQWYLNGSLNIGTGYSLNEADWWVSEGKILGFSRSQDDVGQELMYYFEGIPYMIPTVYWVNGTNITYTEPPANSSSNIKNFTQFVNYTTAINWTKIIPTTFWGHSPDLIRLSTSNKHLLIFRARGNHNYFIGYKLLPASLSSIPVISNTFDEYATKCLVKTSYGQSRSDMAYPSAVLCANETILIVYYDIAAGGIFGRVVREVVL
jgi:hypothetical protein